MEYTMKAPMHRFVALLAIATFLSSFIAGKSPANAEDPVKVMVIGGQNNHNWSKSTPHLAKILNAADGIEATVNRTSDSRIHGSRRSGFRLNTAGALWTCEGIALRGPA
jgi:hypothetical protein